MRKVLLIVLLSYACAPKPSKEGNTLAQISDPEIMKYAVIGKTIYENTCANCHQSNGEGLGKLIPPLQGSDYFRASLHRTIWIIKNGQKGEIEVNGQKYDQTMPPNPQLTPLEIAQISTYLYNIWGMNQGVISSSDVEKFLNERPENY